MEIFDDDEDDTEASGAVVVEWVSWLWQQYKVLTMQGCNWLKDDQKLSWSLITAITDNPTIKQGLFPSPGANLSSPKGGGKLKTEYHQQLCDDLFTQHPEYLAAWLAVKNAKGKGAAKKWATCGNKIKTDSKHREF